MPTPPPVMPDCVQCQFMQYHRDKAAHCLRHDVVLHSPVNVFCTHLTPRDEGDQVWVSQTLAPHDLEANGLYTWLAGGRFALIARLTDYADWTAGRFWQVIRRLRREAVAQDDA